MPDLGFSKTEILFAEALAIIFIACIAVPLFRRLGLGTILGYLATGVIIGAFLSLGFAKDPDKLLHFAEFGVVLFLFVIGLELNPSKLWQMRGDIFGMGLCQMLVCGVLLTIPSLLLGLSWQISVVIGLGLALSSTAMVMQTLDESGDRATEYGRKAFAVLLFQDLAIVPLLLMVSLLAPAGEEMGFVSALKHVGIAVLAIGALIAIGKYLLDPVFRAIARYGVPEIMTAFALGVVIAAALLMDLAGMSYAMGAFVAGVMLAESSFRHEIEADIEPFRGLFLGLFFVAVGVSLDLRSVADNWVIILAAVPVAMALKAMAIYVLVRVPPFRTRHNPAVQTAMILPQFGEFGFVLFAAAASVGLFDRETAAILIAIVTLSMAISPLVLRATPILMRTATPDEIDEDFSDAGGRALIIGFGRFGQVVSQPLRASDVQVTVLDNDAERVREAGEFGYRIHFGDGSRRDVLRAAGAAKADLIAVCVEDAAEADRIVQLVQGAFPDAKLLVRAIDRGHAIRLVNKDVDAQFRETLDSAFRMGAAALDALGLPDAEQTIETLRHKDAERLAGQAAQAKESGLDARAAVRVKPAPL